MSKDVSLEQAQKLCAIGFNRLVDKSYNVSTGEIISHVHVNANALDGAFYSSPTVSDALDYLREEKGVECGVIPICESFAKDNPDGLLGMSTRFIGYDYSFFDKSDDKGEIVNMTTFDTHPLASSALLDAVLTYLEKK